MRTMNSWSAALTPCSKTHRRRSNGMPPTHTKRQDSLPMSTWKRSRASPQVSSSLSAAIPKRPQSMRIWQLRICPTTPIRWVRICPPFRMPTRALPSRTTRCSTTSSWATAAQSRKWSDCLPMRKRYPVSSTTSPLMRMWWKPFMSCRRAWTLQERPPRKRKPPFPALSMH